MCVKMCLCVHACVCVCTHTWTNSYLSPIDDFLQDCSHWNVNCVQLKLVKASIWNVSV